MGVCENPLKEGSRGKLTLELTTSALCDMNCTYCFEGVKSNPKKLEDLDLLIKRVNEIVDSEWAQTNYDGVSISFWGGEPTLNYNYIRKLTDAFRTDGRVQFHMYSNGYNIENMKKVVEHVLDIKDKFEIQISYDGRLINDAFRINHSGGSTADKVLQTFKYIADLGFSVNFKSTVPGSALNKLYDTWLNFYELHLEYKDYKNVMVRFAPTIDYSMIHVDMQNDVDVFRNEILKIAKKEIEFFQENNRHLMSWFGGADTKVNCSAGLNMIAVDVDGSTYACHGSMYTDKKDELKSGSIFDNDFINNIIKFNDSFETSVHNIPEECKGCTATTCIICPVSTFTNSNKTDFFERWEDRGINGLCAYYKAFGEIDRSVQNYFKKNKK